MMSNDIVLVRGDYIYTAVFISLSSTLYPSDSLLPLTIILKKWIFAFLFCLHCGRFYFVILLPFSSCNSHIALAADDVNFFLLILFITHTHYFVSTLLTITVTTN